MKKIEAVLTMRNAATKAKVLVPLYFECHSTEAFRELAKGWLLLNRPGWTFYTLTNVQIAHGTMGDYANA